MRIKTKQIDLFRIIQGKYKTKKQFLEGLREKLPYQNSALYARIRGDTILSLEEFYQLCKDYHVCTDMILGLGDQKILFEYPTLSYKDHNDPLMLYLNQLQSELDQVFQLTDKQVYYQARELPTFYYFKYPQLALFKLYIYHNSSWRDPSTEIQKFSFDRINFDHDMKSLMKSIFYDYTHLKRKEYWLSNPFQYTLMQILNASKNNSFINNEDALTLCDQLLKLNHDLKILAKPAKRDEINDHESPHFHLYHNVINSHNNMILFESNEVKLVFNTLRNPNHIKCFDPSFISLTKDWIKRTEEISKDLTLGPSGSISNYFTNNKKIIKKVRQQIVNQIKVLDGGILF